MTENTNQAIRPHRVNAGGIFIALTKGAIQPLFAVLIVPFALLIPSLVSSFYFHVFSKQNFKISAFKPGFTKSLDIKAVILSEIIYLASLYGMFRYVAYKTAIYLEIYKAKALNNQVIQIATPEQIEYAHSLTTMYAICGLFVFVLFVLIASFTFRKCYEKEHCVALKQTFISTTVKAIFKNLPSYILFYIGLCFVFIVIETYFARFKIIFIEARILNQEAFDPMIYFVLLRVFVLHISIYCINLFTYCALNLTNKLYLKDKSSQS